MIREPRRQTDTPTRYVYLATNGPTAIVEPAVARSKKVEAFVRMTASGLFVFGTIALVARLFDSRLVVPIDPLTGGAFLALAIAVFCVSSDDPRAQLVGKLVGTLIALVGAVVSAACVFDVDFEGRLGVPGSALPMTLPNAVEFALLGAAALAVDVETSPRQRLTDLLALGALLVLVRLGLAHLFTAGHSGGPPGIPLAAALLFAFAAAALLCVRLEAGALLSLVRAAAASRLVRRLLPLTVVAPIAVTYLAVIALRYGWIDVAGTVSLLATLAMAASAGFVWMGSAKIHRAEEAVGLVEDVHSRLVRETVARTEAERSRAHYLQLLHDLDALVWEADLSAGKLTFASAGVRETLGDSAERWLAGGDFWSSVVHPQDRARVGAALVAAADAGRDCDFEFRAVAADGRVRWLRTRLYMDTAGGERRWQRGAMIDVTEKKEGEQRLAAQNEVAKALGEAQTLAAALPRVLGVLGSTLGWDAAAAWTLDRELGVLRAIEIWQARGAEGFTIVSRGQTVARGDEIAGRVWGSGGVEWADDLAREDASPRASVAAAEGIHAVVGFPIRAREEFLGVIELFGQDVRPRDDGLASLLSSIGSQIGQFIDRRRSEERLREESAALETVNRLSPTFSGTLELDKLIQALTEAATKLVNAQLGTFFYQPKDGDGYRSYTASNVSRDAFGLAAPRPTRFPARLFSSDGPLRIDDVRVAAGQPGFDGPFGGAAIASYLAVPVVSRTGRILGGLALSHSEAGVFTKREERLIAGIAAHAAVAIDNAELYESERHARAAAENASRAKDEFLAMLGHELRNPIGAIRNSVEALEMAQARNGDGAGEMLCSIIGRQTDTLAQLVDDLLDVTRLISGKIRLRTRVVDLMELTSQTLESLRAGGKGSRHFLRFAGEPAFVDGDPVRLEQIVTNLVENAIKYTPEGGEIDIAVERDGDCAQLRIRDNGQGIAPDLLPRIFDLFVQGKQSLDRPRGGLGVGLTLVRRLAELHGGSVEAESAGVDQGSEFRVRFPARAPSEGATIETADEEARFTPRHVLIAEDHGDSRESLRLLLEASGHRVDAARNGDEAVELALGDPPEIALIDIGLPGLDGYDVAREMRAAESTEGIYLVALTGYGQPLDRRRALESGFNEHLVKPLNREKLLRLMASLEAPASKSS
jgi:PAS domain S-box-containing protein